jgi:hypothetical protein
MSIYSEDVEPGMTIIEDGREYIVKSFWQDGYDVSLFDDLGNEHKYDCDDLVHIV